jgi:hypothetical protein
VDLAGHRPDHPLNRRIAKLEKKSEVINMALKREVSLGVGLATAALVYAVYSRALPTLADVRAGAPADVQAGKSEKSAAWTATAVVAAVSLLSRDPTVFIIGGASVVGLSWLHRHANFVNPSQGAASMPTSRTVHNDLLNANAGYTPSG